MSRKLRWALRVPVLIVVLVMVVVTGGPADAGFYRWTPQQLFGGTTSHSPALGSGSGCFYPVPQERRVMVWKGEGSDQRIFFVNPLAGPGQQMIPGARTNDGPALTCAFEQMLVAWKDPVNDIYVSAGMPESDGDGVDWIPPQRVGRSAASKPSITTTCFTNPDRSRFRSAPYVVWRGLDQSIYYSFTDLDRDLDPTEWSPVQAVSNDAYTDTDPVVNYDRNQIVTVAWKEAGGVHMLRSKTPTKVTDWSFPEYIGGGGGTSTGPVLSNHVVVWKGIGNDPLLWYTVEIDHGLWQPQRPICSVGGASAAPSITAETFYKYQVVWKGAGTDPRIFTSFGELSSTAPGCT